ncbi:MAG: arginine deiminase family protein, partial [Pararhodobacter sp.]
MNYGAEDRSKPLARVIMRAPGPAMASADPAAWHYGPGFDPARAEVQHAALADIVAAAGAEIHWIPAADDGMSDAVFVQDPSFVTRAGAVVLNMGKALRRGEPDVHAARYEARGVPVIGRLTGDATVESGDCVWIDAQTLAIGRGARSNQAGIDAVAAIL